MSRSILLRAMILAGGIAAAAAAHDGPQHHDNPLACDPAAGETCYYAVIDDFHTADSPHPNAFGDAFFALSADQSELRYHISINGLNLKPDSESRTQPDDIIGVHLHLNVPDTVGPHVLNIFGLATYNRPAEEDADLVVDFTHQTLQGIYDDSDATIDPTTGQPYLPFFPLTSKPLRDWLDTLDAGDLMVAVHTVASGFPTMAIHGHIARVPEPTVYLLATLGFALWPCRAWRRGRHHES